MALIDPETGKEMTFSEVVVALLVAEYRRTKEEAWRMVKSHPNIVTNGIMANMNYRACAMALEIAESKST